jgi:hypothetical protein
MDKDKDSAIIDLDADQVIEEREQTETHAAPQPVAKKSMRNRLLLLGLGLLAAAIAGGWFYRDVASNYFPSDQMRGLSEKLLAMETAQSTLNEKLAKLEKENAQVGLDLSTVVGKSDATAGELGKTRTVLGEAVKRVESVEQGLNDAKASLSDLAKRPVVSADPAAPVDNSALLALQTRIDMLEKDLATLKAAPNTAAQDTAVLSQSLADLKALVTAGAGYAAEIERIQRMVPAAEGLDVLKQHAALGLPDSKGLAKELTALVADLPKPLVPGPTAESQGWWSGLVDSLSDLVTIRVEGDVDWPKAALSAAALADSGDLPQAIEQLRSVEAEKPPGISQWLERAQARLNIEASLKSVEDAVLRVIAAKG